MNHFNNDNRDPRDRDYNRDRDYVHRDRDDNQSMWLILGLIALVAAALIWYLSYHSRISNPFVSTQQTEQVQTPETNTAEEITQQTAPVSTGETGSAASVNEPSATESKESTETLENATENESGLEVAPITPSDLTSTPELTTPENAASANTELGSEAAAMNETETTATVPASNAINSAETPAAQ